MEQMTITAKVQIAATDADKVLLDETMSVYRDACNYVSDYVFQTHDLKQFSLNKVLYSTLREKFGLKSQMAQSVLKTVIARYRTILENQNKWIRPTFKKPQYDLVWNRDYSLTQNCFSVNTLNGRVKLPYFAEGIFMLARNIKIALDSNSKAIFATFPLFRYPTAPHHRSTQSILFYNL